MTLRELRGALPQLLPGESPPEADFRLASSPLLVDPHGELAIATSPGRELLPEALKQASKRRPGSHPPPLALSVADTVDLPELGALPDARAQAESLPRSVVVLGGPHWSTRVASVEAFAEKLRELGPDITAAFFCHAVRG